MSTEDAKEQVPWARQLATLQTRATRHGLRSGPSPLAEITEDTLAVGVAMLQELAKCYLDCKRLRSEVRTHLAAWQHLFEVMPTPCVITDDTGVIVEANPASACVLNVSSRRLCGRPLAFFFNDRTAFAELLRGLQAPAAPAAAHLTVRPRERKPMLLPIVVAPASTSGGDLGLWFLGAGQDDEAQRGGGLDRLRPSPRPVAFRSEDAVRERLCEQCGSLTGSEHGSADCIRQLEQRIEALTERRDDLRSRLRSHAAASPALESIDPTSVTSSRG